MSNENYLLISWLVYSTSDHVDSDSEVNTGRFRFEIFCKTERLRTICLLYGFLLCLCRPPIGPWSLWENNALEPTTNTSHILIPVVTKKSFPNKLSEFGNFCTEMTELET